MDGGVSIGELARRTGLTVKAIRLYSDRGIVVPAGRTAAGHRRYPPSAVARLALVRTLRELGLGLDAIHRIVAGRRRLGEVAAEHAAALDLQIAVLRTRRAVLAAVAGRDLDPDDPEEMELMHRLARLSQAERRRLVDDFLDAVFDGLDPRPEHAAARRSLTPELPDDPPEPVVAGPPAGQRRATPTDEQLAAWLELADLAGQPGFRATLRRMAANHAAELPAGTPPRPDVVAVARDLAGPALADGIAPDSPAARPVVAALTAHWSRALSRPDDADLRRWLLDHLDTANDPRRDRYLHLLSQLNGWPAPDPLTPALSWTVTALRVELAAA
jgi:DNA-binding transcriptional MerR regulator